MPDQNSPSPSFKIKIRPQPGPNYAHRDLRHLNLRGRNLEGADFRKADLRGADLRGCDLFAARFSEARLEGCRFEMSRLVEIWIPKSLSAPVANQIRAFDFGSVMTRFVGPNRHSEELSCPYKSATLRPILYEWGSRCWRQGADWNPPTEVWTLEEIIASVLDELGCTHDWQRPFKVQRRDVLEASW